MAGDPPDYLSVRRPCSGPCMCTGDCYQPPRALGDGELILSLRRQVVRQEQEIEKLKRVRGGWLR